RLFYYEPTVSYDTAATELTEDFRSRMFDGSTAALVRCLFQGKPLQPDEVDELQSIIDQMGSKKSKDEDG
ncbi:MAG: BlaI/MecI/CopY family transcriptional regulator, partial [Verrucomicrobiota bacterium]